MSDEVRKYGYSVPMSDEQIAIMEAEREAMAALDRLLMMSPAERRAHLQQMKEKRAAERDAARSEALSLSGVLDKLGWSENYAHHFVQTYCTCGMTDDGWHYCQHAYDRGLAP